MGSGRAFAPRWRTRADELAIDLGTANVVVYRAGEGIVAFEPAVVAIEESSGSVYAVGAAAKRMIGRTPGSIKAVRPLRHGVIADFDVTEQMLRYFMRKGRRAARARVVLCVPSGVTDVERRAVVEAAVAAGASHAYLIEEPMAGAIGAGLAVEEPSGTMVVDIGGGTSESAVISLGGIVVAQSLRVGGYDLDEAIVRHVRDTHKLLIGSERAEEVKLAIGSVYPDASDHGEADAAGRDLSTGLLRRTTLTSAEVREALEKPIAQIAASVVATLEQSPPDLAADIAVHGLTLVGGGALLRGIDARLRKETGLAARIADDPLTAVARGSGLSLEQIKSSGALRADRAPRLFTARPRRRAG